MHSKPAEEKSAEPDQFFDDQRKVRDSYHDSEPSISVSAHSLASSVDDFAKDMDIGEQELQNSFAVVSAPEGRYQVDWRNIKVRVKGVDVRCVRFSCLRMREKG